MEYLDKAFLDGILLDIYDHILLLMHHNVVHNHFPSIHRHLSHISRASDRLFGICARILAQLCRPTHSWSLSCGKIHWSWALFHSYISEQLSQGKEGMDHCGILMSKGDHSQVFSCMDPCKLAVVHHNEWVDQVLQFRMDSKLAELRPLCKACNDRDDKSLHIDACHMKAICYM